MRALILFIFLAITNISFGQIKFEKGYFIDNDNQKVDCFIKNNDWKNNPKAFKYKLNENSVSQEIDITKAREFVILGSSKYIRANVKIDRSFIEGDIEKLTIVKTPVWSDEQLFLKVVSEGKASLYSYEEDNLLRFFYSVKDSVIQQLIYKEYILVQDGQPNTLAANFGFRQQLWLDVKCTNANMNSVKSLKYNKTELEKYFKKYHECSGDSSLVINKVKQSSLFHLKFTPGINSSSFTITYIDGSNFGKVSDNNTNLRIGLEAELLLPFKKNKWGVVFEPTYRTFNSKTGPFYEFKSATINYNSIEFPLGIRHYFFINNNLKIYLNAFYIPYYELKCNSKVVIDNNTYDLNPILSVYSAGGGFCYKRMNAEVRYYSDRSFLDNDYFNYSYNNRLNVILGFRIF